MPGRSESGSRRGSRLRRSLAVAAAVVLGVAAQPAIADAATPSATVDGQVLKELASRGSTGFMVFLRERAKLDGAATLRDSDAKAAEVYQQLTGTAGRSQ